MAITRRKKTISFPSPDASEKSYEALIQLWVLRLLVPLGGSREFIVSYGYQQDHLANYLGLPSVDGNFDMKPAMAELRKKHDQAERRLSVNAIPEVLARNIERYGELLGWNDVDKAVVAFAVLMETDPRLEVACSTIENVATARLIDVLSGVLGFDRDLIRLSVSPKGSLSESCFIKIDPSIARSLATKISMLSDETSDRLRYFDGDPFELLRDIIAPAAKAELTLGDFSHV